MLPRRMRLAGWRARLGAAGAAHSGLGAQLASYTTWHAAIPSAHGSVAPVKSQLWVDEVEQTSVEQSKAQLQT
jgi:hypothetical protein